MADNGFTLEGKLYRKWDTEVKDLKYHTRRFIIQLHEEYQGNDYYQYVPCELRGETRCPVLERFEEGWDIKIHCNMRGQKYNPKDTEGNKIMTEEKYFSSVDVWKIENMNATTSQQQPQPQTQQHPPYYGAPTPQPGQQNNSSQNNNNSSPEAIDDLPF